MGPLLLTSLGLDLKNAFLCASTLESIHQRSLNGKEGPLCVGWGVGLAQITMNDALVGALDGGPIGGQVERCHDVGGS